MEPKMLDMKVWYVLTTVLLLTFATAATKLDLLPMPPPSIIESSSNATTSNPKPVVSFAVLLPYSGFLYPLGSLCTEAIRIALKRVATTDGILDDYNVKVEFIDDQCSRPTHVKRFYNAIDGDNILPSRFPLFVYSPCFGTMYTGMMAKHYNYAGLLGLASTDMTMRLRRRYDGIQTLLASIPMYPKPIAAFMRKVGWTKLAILSETTPYYDALDAKLQAELAVYNFSVMGVSKLLFLPGIPTPEKEFKRAIEELVTMKARIIYIGTNNLAKVTCWLFHFKIYGPGYVIFTIGENYLAEDTRLRYSWCSKNMIATVRASMVFQFAGKHFGVGGIDTPDSLGNTVRQHIKTLQDRIDRPERSDFWNTPWPNMCYDSVAGSLILLNATDSYLKNRGSSLGDWLVRSENFKKNGSFIFQTMKEIMSHARYQAIRGDVEIDPNTGGNRLELVPLIFYQVKKSDSKVTADGSAVLNEWVPVPFYVSIKSELIELAQPEWYTANGGPPFDSIRYVTTYFSLCRVPTFAVFVVIGVFLIVANVFIIIWRLIPDGFKSLLRYFQVFGHLVLLAHVFALPFDIDQNAKAQSFVSFGLLGIGISVVFSSISLKLEYIYRGSRIADEVKRLQLSVKLFAVGMLWTAILAVLLVALFMLESFNVVLETTSEVTSSEDISVVIVEKQANLKKMTDNKVLESVIGVVAVVHGLAIIRNILTITSLKSRKLRLRELDETIAMFCFVLTGVMFALFVGAVIYIESVPKMILVYGSVALCIVAINSFVLIFAKFIISTGRFEQLKGLQTVARTSKTSRASNRASRTASTTTK